MNTDSETSLMHPQMPLIVVGGRQMRRIEKSTSTKWGSLEMATARSLLEPYVTEANEHLIRTFHPALAAESEVFTLTQKQTGHQAWVIPAQHASSSTFYTHAAGRPIYIQPFFESPVGRGREFSMTIPDPIPHEINVHALMTPEDSDLISLAFPESVGVIVYKCDCVVVLFPSREAMLRTWAAGTPDTLGGLMVGYKVREETFYPAMTT